MRSIRLFLLLALAGITGCTGGDGDPTVAPDGAVTYHKDVAPLLNNRCLSCHMEGGIAPMALDSYESAKQWAAAMRFEVVNRTMPPWPVLSDGSCRNYQDSRALTDDEIAVFGKWMDAGTPEGDPAHGPGPYQPPPGLGSDAVELAMIEPYTPWVDPSSGGQDDHRCFVIPTGLTQDRFVTAFEVVPGQAEMVHHMLVYSVDPDEVVGSQSGQSVTNGEVLTGLEAQDDRPGFSCYGLAGEGVVPNGLPATWTPGTGVTTYPGGTGVRLQAGNVLVMQVHYNLDSGVASDQSRLRLQLEEQVIREGFVLLYDGLLETAIEGEPYTLAPGKASVDFTWTVPFQRLRDFAYDYAGYVVSEVELYGVFPHMHTLGRSMQAYLRGGTDKCVTQVPRWDFHWQQFYFYESPLTFREGDSIEITCNYSTDSRSEPTYPGYSTSDEMCLFGAYLTLPLPFP